MIYSITTLFATANIDGKIITGQIARRRGYYPKGLVTLYIKEWEWPFPAVHYSKFITFSKKYLVRREG